MSTEDNTKTIFINRRKTDRREDEDPCKDMPVDLYHRKRRKKTDRRQEGKTLADDYYHFTRTQEEQPEDA